MNKIKNLSFLGICLAFIVIALGAWTRLVDAGLGCPDWPGCYGFVVFPINETDIAIAESLYPEFPYDINKAIPEVVHRYFAAALGLFAIFLVYLSFKQNENKNIRLWTIGLLIFICCQGVFGYLTVSLKLLPIIVTGHLFGGFTTLTLFFYIFLMSKLWFTNAAPLASTLGILLITQISLGIINVVYVLPLYVAIAHNLVAATLLLTIFTINYLAWKK